MRKPFRDAPKNWPTISAIALITILSPRAGWPRCPRCWSIACPSVAPAAWSSRPKKARSARKWSKASVPPPLLAGASSRHAPSACPAWKISACWSSSRPHAARPPTIPAKQARRSSTRWGEPLPIPTKNELPIARPFRKSCKKGGFMLQATPILGICPLLKQTTNHVSAGSQYRFCSFHTHAESISLHLPNQRSLAVDRLAPAGANGDQRDGRLDQGTQAVKIAFRCWRQVGVAGDLAGLATPAGQFFINRLAGG